MSRGFTLIEAVIALAIAALAAIAIAPVVSASARTSSRATDPLYASLSGYAASLARDAAQSWKYGAPSGVAPQTYSASIFGGPASAPVPVTVSQSITPIDAVSAQLTVTVSSGSASASASTLLAVQAPLPGSDVARPGLVPMPAASPGP